MAEALRGLAESLLSNIKFLFTEPQPYARFGDTEVQSSACCHTASIPVRKTGNQQVVIKVPLSTMTSWVKEKMHWAQGVNNGVLTKFEGLEEFPEEVMTA